MLFIYLFNYLLSDFSRVKTSYKQSDWKEIKNSLRDSHNRALAPTGWKPRTRTTIVIIVNDRYKELAYIIFLEYLSEFFWKRGNSFLMFAQIQAHYFLGGFSKGRIGQSLQG